MIAPGRATRDREAPLARRFRWVFGVLGAVAIALFAFAILHKAPAKAAKPPAVPVTVAKAATQDFPVSITALGAAQAWKSDTIVAQVSGILTRVAFTEGANVKAGQLLAQIDPAPYRAALTQTQGALARDRALLAEARQMDIDTESLVDLLRQRERAMVGTARMEAGR